MSPNAAHAQAPDNVEHAQALFDSGRTLMQEGKYAEACANFAESEQLDPGGGTILNLGICRRREGRTGTAFKVLNDALAQARSDGRNDRVATAERELAELAPILSRLTVQLATGTPAPDLVIELDGEPFAASNVGRSLALDPGVHQLRASRPGYESWSAPITLGPIADQQTITVPVLLPNTPAPAAAVVPPGKPLASAPVQTETPRTAKNPSRVLGFVLVSTGGVALAAGGYFGVRALSLKASSDDHWNGSYCTAASCVEDWNDAKTAAHLSTIGISIGIAALGAGAYLLLRPTTSSHSSVALSLSVSGSNAQAVAIGKF
ncbi:MAG TPA: hypothetical protein VFK05_13905 [Polyangiaceae bacterium]|nr:hypothetical protein [Polyangiaceae bacterium]